MSLWSAIKAKVPSHIVSRSTPPAKDTPKKADDHAGKKEEKDEEKHTTLTPKSTHNIKGGQVRVPVRSAPKPKGSESIPDDHSLLRLICDFPRMSAIVHLPLDTATLGDLLAEAGKVIDVPEEVHDHEDLNEVLNQSKIVIDKPTHQETVQLAALKTKVMNVASAFSDHE